MTITEQEASTKRCQEGFGPPFSDTPMIMSGAAGIAVMTSPTHCIGSGCMAWRWVVADRSDTYGRENKDKGYCGKAGRP